MSALLRTGLFLLLSGLFLFSCKEQRAEPSFYFWKNNTLLDKYAADSAIAALGVQHFYIRYMDVDWSEALRMPVPSGNEGSFPRAYPAGIAHNFTPVIFITNRVFERINDTWYDDSLALKLKASITQQTALIYKAYTEDVLEQLRSPYQPGQIFNSDSLRSRISDSLQKELKEIQVDCDWTAKTRDKYFRFLRSLKQQFPDAELSVTIRLYPYKYPGKMGVPPADRGMLMCYNMGNIGDAYTSNSVFDLETLKQYLGKGEYKFPLDIALPVFGWYAWFRNDQLKGIIYKDELGENDPGNHFKKEQDNQYRLNEDYTINQHYLREGDMLREEFPKAGELEAAARLLKEHFPQTRRITFFHWDPKPVTNYDTTIRKIYALF